MEKVLAQLQRSISNLSDRVAQLEGQNKFQRATDWMRANWWGWTAPTLPASHLVEVRGGTMWWWQDDTQNGYFSKLDDTVYDFYLASAFAQSEAYRWTVLQVDVSGAIASLRLYEDGDEFGTAEQVEADFWATAPTVDLYGDYIPLAAFVLRNDGNLGVAGAIENITLSDKTQSYYVVRDFRPWLHLHKQSA